MPILSMFYGIVVRMYFFDDKQHHVPHVHAEYSGREAVFSIVSGELLAGELPSGKARGSCRRGSKSTVTSCKPHGSWRSTAKKCLKSTH